jgi:exodeoxyribonuclease VII large subunit
MPDRGRLPFDDEVPTDAGPLSISELTAGIKAHLEVAFGSVLVEGEISNCKQWSSGHIYFTLKDDRAQLRAVMFRLTARTLKFGPEDGLHVVARGRLSVYDAKGEYQLVCDSLEPHGLGALQAAFDQLKRRLQSEGLFDQARKRPLPVLPRRIGVVTSLDGAAVRDIVRILITRHPTARVVLRAARVQGETAVDDLIRALRAIVRVPDLDVVIIGRGGGSAEDLSAFNDERLARAIAACPVPVISAVGHEVDFTIADFVADVRAATPSNAAELVVDRADNFCTRIDRAQRRLRDVARLALARRQQRVERARSRLSHWPTLLVLRDRDVRQTGARLERAVLTRIGRAAERVDRAAERLARRDARRVLGQLKTRTLTAGNRLSALITSRQLFASGRLGTLAGRLGALSPLAVLGRGYAVCWNESRTRLVRSPLEVTRGDRVHVRVSGGELGCRVEDTSVLADGTPPPDIK